ncbi:MAG: SGNH/GDSL hydrolase family protein, partial [Myxococcales bacterium]|nr:SGNH/GDSL hydrolase family protein [Myxococcales bacterium]
MKFLVVGALLGMVGCASETSSGGSPLGGTDPSASPATDTQDATPSGGAAGMGAAAPAATTGDVDTGSDAASTGDAPDDAAPAAPAPSADTAADDSTPEATTANADDPAPQTRRPPCLKDPSQVILIGDSYINWVSHTFPGDLFAEAGQTFRNYAVGGYAMGSGGIGFIPPQLDQAIAEDADITTVVMTGGGNDILVPDTLQYPRGGDCKMTEMAPMIDDCRAIVDRALEAADEMMT